MTFKVSLFLQGPEVQGMKNEQFGGIQKIEKKAILQPRILCIWYINKVI